MTDFSQKTVVVTGASRGIGAATARFFAHHGAYVVLAARSGRTIEGIAADITASGHRAIAAPCDVSRLEDVVALEERARDLTGRIDVWINNAGLIDPVAHMADSDPQVWGHVVDVNLKGVYYGMRTVLPGMVAAGAGTIINISSGAATGALEGWSHYCATKAACLSLTRVADREYRSAGVRVLGLSPGTVATDMQRTIRASGINPVSRLDWSAHIPPEDAAQAIGWLATPAADHWRGQDFSIKTPEGRAEAGLLPL